jgi:hypothetical protein
MARILVESLMVRYPLAGMISWTLQYLVGLDRLGHDVVLVERANHDYACFDPVSGTSGLDCHRGVAAVDDALRRAGLEQRWCFVDSHGTHFGKTARQLTELFNTADIFIAMTFEECWHDRARDVPCRVLLDGDPVFRQILHRQAAQAGRSVPHYDAYFTAGLSIQAPDAKIPDDGIDWRPLPHPVATELFAFSLPKRENALTTIMNWQSYDSIEDNGVRYGHKDLEFENFIGLPRCVRHPFEVAIAGAAPLDRLISQGWKIADAHEVTLNIRRFHRFIRESLGEFSVCKHAYVVSRSGWFSDRSGAYLASGRPVILEDTGFSHHLPCGEGLFAFTDVESAVDAIDRVRREPERHARVAREIACAELEATKVMARLMDALP